MKKKTVRRMAAAGAAAVGAVVGAVAARSVSNAVAPPPAPVDITPVTPAEPVTGGGYGGDLGGNEV